MIDLDISQFTDEQIEAQIKLIEEKLEGRLLDSYKPYPKQELFHRLGGDIAISDRLLMAGNQLGKCLIYQSLIELPNGEARPIGELYERGSPFDVYAWDGEKRIVTRAIRPIKKPAEPCVRFWMADGQSFGCALNHRVMLPSGVYVFAQQLLASLPNLQESTSEFDLSIRGVSVPRWMKRVGDCLSGCLRGFRLCDERLRLVTNSVRDWLQGRGDVRVHNYALYGMGGCSSSDTSNYQFSSAPLSNPGVATRFADRCVEFVDRAVCTFVRRTTRCIQGLSQRLVGSLLRLQLVDVENLDQVLPVASESPFSIDGNRIIAYELIPSQEVFDFTVPETSNYIAFGLVHHNTYSAAAETAYHLTGRYPDWWKGKRFQHAVRGWVGSPTSQTTRDAAQRLLMGPIGAFGTGLIPGRYLIPSGIARTPHGVPNAIESVLVKHISGKNSYLQFKTYEQGREKWQGDTLDFVWFDEEPDEEIWSEGRTRTNVPGNFTYMTFTPLKGMSKIVTRFLREKPSGSVVIPMSIEDALHYTPEQRAKVVAGYLPHERKAREKGIPILGSGAVFPIDEEQITCVSFQIPDHWPRICGMDFGWDHPTACAWMAWDRDTDTIYVYDQHRVKEQTAIVHAATMKAKGVWIPVAWPHDGLQHDKGSGAQIAKQYRELGVNMLKDKSTHKPEKGKKEGSGGYGVEAGISEILIRMQTGRFKVFKNLTDWLEEYRTYYREDGLIVKKDDDLMSATRMGVMMLRFAKTKRPEGTPLPKIPAYAPSYSSTGVLG